MPSAGKASRPWCAPTGACRVARELDREAATAAAGRLGVGVADGELRAVQAFDVVDRGAHQVLQAQRVDQQNYAIGIDREVVLALLLVELEAVLEARAAASLDVYAQLQRRVAFLGDQLADLGRGDRKSTRLNSSQ